MILPTSQSAYQLHAIGVKSAEQETGNSNQIGWDQAEL